MQFLKTQKRILRIFGIFIFLFFNIVFAIENTYTVNNDTVTIVVNNDDGINVKLQSSLFNLSKANIFWYIDNKEVFAGVGADNFYTQNNIQNKKLSVKIEEDGEIYNTEIEINNSNMFLYWEAINSTAPSWWIGKRQVPRETEAKVWAIANVYDEDGNIADKNDLNYYWYIDGIYNQGRSGFGKDNAKIFIGLNTLNGTDIKVAIHDRLDNVILEKSIHIDNIDREINMYLQNISSDNLGNSLGEYAFDFKYLNNYDDIYKKNFNIVLEPMFFNANDKSGLLYLWNVNDIEDKISKYVKNINIKEGLFGDLNFDVYVADRKNIDSINKSLILQVK